MSTNPYDQASRYVAKLEPPGLLRWLLPTLAPRVSFQGWLDTRSLPFPGEPDRTNDTVACLRDDADAPTWWALAIEFSSRPDSEMFGRMLEYLGRLWRERRPTDEQGSRFQVGGAVVNLTGVGQASRDLQLPQNTGIRTCLQLAERNLVQEDAAATLAEMAAGRVTRCLLPWIPLMNGGGEPGIIDEWVRQAQAEPDAARRGDYGGLALVFAELAGSRDRWREALRGWNVLQSQQVLEWQANATANALLRMLQRRFHPEVPAELVATIQATTDMEQLNRWIDAAVTSASLDDFRQTIQK
jgi:hypothetical protein